MTTAIITGGAGFSSVHIIEETLGHCRDNRALTKIIISGASKAEKLSASWARLNGVQVVTFDMDYSLPRDEAVSARNAAMLEVGADFVIAFHGGNSAADMCAKAEALGVLVLRVEK